MSGIITRLTRKGNLTMTPDFFEWFVHDEWATLIVVIGSTAIAWIVSEIGF